MVEKTFDEEGYIAMPPCIFGDEKDDLLPPVSVSNRTIQFVKYCNRFTNTYINRSTRYALRA